MRLLGANRSVRARGIDELPGKTHYFVGRDPAKWRTNVPTFAKVRYDGVYPGIDLVYYGNQQQLEYDFLVAPGADPAAIQFSLETGDSKRSVVDIDDEGNLVIRTTGGTVRMLKPVVYQPTSATHSQSVESRFVLRAENRVAFEIGSYDKSRPLVIDPLLSYGSYFGSGGFDIGGGITADDDGNAYVAGRTCLPDAPGNRLLCDAIVTKIDASGTRVVYSTIIAGSGHHEGAGPIKVDALGNAFIAGNTCSPDFPVTAGAFQTTLGGACAAFVSKLDAAGKPVYATYLGGTRQNDGGDVVDIALAMTADAAGNVYVAGESCSADFPTKNGFQTTFPGNLCDAFASKLNPAGRGASDLLYSTYFGGSEDFAAAFGIAVDSTGLAYVVAETGSLSVPTTPGAFQTAPAGDFDVIVAKIDMTKSGLDSLLYSTFLGGSGQESFTRGAIAVDATGNVYVTGLTNSVDFPTTAGAFQPSLSPPVNPGSDSFDSFVAKLNPAGAGASDLVYSTYLGAAGIEDARAMAVTPSGDVVVVGDTTSSHFPVTSDAIRTTLSGVSDAFVVKLNPGGRSSADLVYSTYLGGGGADAAFGVALDSAGIAYLTGSSGSLDFPHTPDAPQTTFGGGSEDGFVARIPFGNFSLTPVAPITFDTGQTGTLPITATAAGEFSAPVTLSLTDQPAGFAVQFAPSSITPSAGQPAASVLTFGGLAAPAGTFTIRVTGTSGLLSQSVSTQVTIRASAGGTASVVSGLTAAGCIDNAGIGGSLINKLADAQRQIDAGRIQDAINTLNSLLNQLLAQGGKHIVASCTVNGQTFSPVDVLISNVRAILATLNQGP